MTTQIAKYKRCEDCNGVGEVNTMESVYSGADSHIQAPVGSELCNHCGGTGIENDADIIIERIIDNLDMDQENTLQEYFVGLMEINGVPIMKDNCEDMFERWLCSVELKTLEKVLYGNKS